MNNQKQSFFSKPAITDPLADKINLEGLGYSQVEYLGGSPDAGRSTYKVHDPELDKAVVIKVAFFHACNWDALRSLRDGEFRSLEALEHPQIPQVYSALEPDGHGWIGVAMEYIEGTPVSESSLDASEVVQLAESLIDILVAIQEKRLVHLDIKPENILRKANGEFVLVDFGVSKQLKSDASGASTVLGGTVCFTDPRVMLLRQNPTMQSDLYSVGCTLGALLLGMSTFEFIEAVGLTQVYDFLKARRKPNGVSDSFWNWLLSLVQVQGNACPYNAREALSELQKVLTPSLPVVVTPPTVELASQQEEPSAEKKSPLLISAAGRIFRTFRTAFSLNRLGNSGDPFAELDETCLELEGDLQKMRNAYASAQQLLQSLKKREAEAAETVSLWKDRLTAAKTLVREDAAELKLKAEKALSQSEQHLGSLSQQCEAAAAHCEVVKERLLELEQRQSVIKQERVILKARHQSAKALKEINGVLGVQSIAASFDSPRRMTLPIVSSSQAAYNRMEQKVAYFLEDND